MHIVGEFLETALIVDDEGGLLTEADLEGESGVAAKEGASVVASRTDLTLETPSEGSLRAVTANRPLASKTLLDAFADMGVVCSLLAPRKGDEITKRFLRVAARADLLVLDWELHGDLGDTARKLLKAIFAQDASKERKRLRLIAIYTAEPGLVPVMDKIRTDLELPKEALSADGLTLAQDNLRITAFGKPQHESTGAVVGTREISEADLPATLAGEFAQSTNGLVPAVALAALAAIRNDTHRILQALPADLDIGYLGHRVASSFPEDAQGHLVELIAAEIGSVLSEGEVGRRVDLGVIEKWLGRAIAADPPLVCGSELQPQQSFSGPEMTKLLTIGLGLDEKLGEHTKQGLNEKKLKHIRKLAARIFANDGAVADESADRFGLRMAVRTVYASPKRVLRLGVIVRHDGGYLICLQPRCDSVRLKVGEPRGFPFLPLKVVQGPEPKPHEFVVQDPDDRSLVRLHIQAKPFNLLVRQFLCNDNRYVEAASAGPGNWEFTDADAASFRWVAELKPEFAQRVAVNLAAGIARVGLAESELVRLSQD
jgi:hypothetical protein